MIRRIRDRRTFERLTRHGVRLRRSVLWCRWCPDPDSAATQVAFAIGRACGPAVTRNRIRRRLRAILAELDRIEPLPPGQLLIGATPTAAGATFDRLRAELSELIASLPRAESAV